MLVETLTSEFRLRNRDWIEHNRQRVLEASDGTIGYIYVPDTSVSGQTELRAPAQQPNPAPRV